MPNVKNVLTIELFEASTQNEVKVGGTVENKTVRDGNQKKDLDGNLVFTPEGEPITWDNTYYIDFSFQGGKHSFKVSKEIYGSVDVGKRYQFLGRVEIKTPYGEGRPYISIEPINFEFLF